MSVFFMHVCCVISIKYDDDIDDDEDWPWTQAVHEHPGRVYEHLG